MALTGKLDDGCKIDCIYPKFPQGLNMSQNLNFTEDGKFLINRSNTLPIVAHPAVFMDAYLIDFNGTRSYYFPKSFVDKGYLKGNIKYNNPKSGEWTPSGGNSMWTGSLAFLQPETYEFLKPATLGSDFTDFISQRKNDSSYTTGSGFQSSWKSQVDNVGYPFIDIQSIPNYQDGYIIDAAKYQEILRKNNIPSMRTTIMNPPRAPDRIAEINGKPAYVGMTQDTSGRNQRYDMMYVNNDNKAGKYEYKWSSSLLNIPIFRILDTGFRIFNPMYNLARSVQDLAMDRGSVGDVALALVGANLPNSQGITAAQGTFFDIPQIASATNKIADFYSLNMGFNSANAVKAAKATIDVGIGLVSNGMNFESALQNAAASYVGREAAGQIAKLVSPLGSSVQKITTATTAAATKALLLNQDAEKAAKFAFISTSVPLAVNGALDTAGFNLPSSVKTLISNSAIQAALNPNADLSAVLKNAAFATVSEAAFNQVSSQLVNSGVIKSADAKALALVRDSVNKLLAGYKPGDVIAGATADMILSSTSNTVNDWSAKKEGWSGIDQKRAAQQTYGNSVTPALYADKQDTTEAEAKQLAKTILGRDATEFELLELIGLPESNTKALLEQNKNTFDTYELSQAYKAVYGKEPSKEWLKSKEAADMLKSTEAQGKNLLNQYYTKDKNTTNNTEAEAIWKEMGNTGPIPEDLLFKMLSTSEDATRAMSETHRIRSDDIEKTTFNGSGYDSRVAAERAAKAAGYSTYKWDGADYPIRATAEIKAIQDKRHELTEGILKQQGTTVAEATDKQLIAALAKVDAVPTSYLKQATIQDVIKGTYSVIDADGKFKAEVTGANIVADSPASVVQKAKDQLPKGVTLASTAEVWGVDGARNPNVKITILPDGTAAFVKNSDNTEITELPEQFIVAKRLDDLEVNDPEAWLGLAAQFDKDAKGNVGDYLVNTANSLMLGAYATGNKDFGDDVKQTLSLVTQAVGQQTADLASAFASQLGLSYDNAFVRAGKALQEWGAANQTKSTKNQEEGFFKRINDAKGVVEKIKAIPGAIRDYPGGFTTMVLKEGIQEILPLWAARSVAHLGRFAAHSANTAVEVVEVWGNGAGETYADAIKMGYSEQDARVMASKVGLQSAAITAVTNGIGDIPLVNRVIGGAVKDSLTGITKAGVREGVTNYFDELGQNAAKQYQLTGKVNWDQATTAATIGMGVGAGTTSGIMLGASINSAAVIGKDSFGRNVSYADFMSGAKQVDMKTLNLNTQVGTAKDGDPITLGSITAMPMSSGISYDMVKSGLPPALTNTNVVIGRDALGNNVTLSSLMSGAKSDSEFASAYSAILNTTPKQRADAQRPVIEQALKDAGLTTYSAADINSLISSDPKGTSAITSAAAAYAGPRVTTTAEATKMLRDAGYTNPTAKEIAQFIGPVAESVSASKIASYVAPRMVTRADAEAFFKNQGYTPSKAEIDQFVRQGEAVVKSNVEAELKKYVDPRQITQAEAQQFFKDFGYTPSKEELASYVRQGANINQDAIRGEIGAYVDPRMVTQVESRDQFVRTYGYNPTDAEVAQFVGQRDQAATFAEIGKYVDPRTVTSEEARAQFVETYGYNPTQAEIDQFVGQRDQANTFSEIGSYVNPRQVTKAEAAAQFKDVYGYNPTDAEVAQFVGQRSQESTFAEIGSYVDPRQVTQAEAEQFFRDFGYTPTPQELASYVRQGADVNQENVRSELGAYIDPRMVTEQEARDAYAALGLKKPTQEDILKLVGQYDQANLSGKATENLDSAKYNSIIEQIEQLGTQAGVDPAVLDAIKNDINSQITALGGDVSKLQSGVDSVVSEQAKTQAQITDLQNNLSEEIQAAKDIGLEGDAALQAGLDSLSEKMGVDQAALLTQLGTTAADLKTQFASDIAASQEATAEEIANTKTALEAAIADAKASGLEGDAALKAAIDSVAADQKTSSADLLTKLGTTEAGLKSEFAAGLAGVSAEVANTRKALEDAIQAAKDIGLQGDAALQAGIDSVAANLGTTKEALLTQLGTTEETLRADMEAGLAGVTTSIADTKKALETAIADAKASGLEGDAALKAAIDSVAADQQTNAADLLTKLGTTEAALKTEFEAGLAGVSTEIANAKKALEDAIQAAKDIGLEGDVALQAGIDSVASELGITKEALLTQLGTTEQALRTEFATGITSLETQMKAQYEALTAAQKAEADARLAQGQTLEQAIAAAKGETAGQISALEAATKAQYETLTAAQKAAADALVAQGQTLQDAITAAKTETAGQIAGVETRLTDAIAAAEAMGLSRDQAITAAVDSVAAELGTTRADLLTQLGTTEAALRTEFATGISGLEAQTKAQYDSLSAAQKATADALVAQGTTLADAIASAQQQTAGQIADVETRLTDAIAAAEATGLSRDQAITAAVESVAADLGTTKADLLTQLGTTEQALRTEFTTGLAGVSAEVKAAYDSLTADQKALADQLAQQGVDLTTAIQTAQAQTQGQIGELTADVQAKFDALTEEQKALATSLQQQGVDLNTAIETAQQQTQQQISDLGVEVDARINELMQQGQTYQQATQQAFAEVNAKNQEMAGLIGTQGRTASQQDIDALTQMLSGQREVDLNYDVTGDKQITQADIDFLTQVIGGVKTDWTAPQESPWAATGLYGQIQANELRRQQDLAAAEAQRVADQQAAAERARQESVRGGLRTTALQGQQQLQALQQQLPQAMQMAQTTTTPIYGEMGPYLDLGSPLDFDFFKPSPEKQAATKQTQPTKIAAGGYIDDLLAEGMSVDDLMNLLR
jgi:hypothetical protein